MSIVVAGLTADLEVPCEKTPVGSFFLRSSYVEAASRAGGLPLVLPHLLEPRFVESYLDAIDVLVVTGGAFDVPAGSYGESDGPGMGTLKPGRTDFEMAMMRGALRREMPLLGVCGGMQLLNVVYGGTLHQDITRELPSAADHEQDVDSRVPSHEVVVASGSKLASFMEDEKNLMVNSTHHQAVKALGPGLVVSGESPDGVVEAIEDPSRPFVLGVQWHPELLAREDASQQRIYDALIEAATSRRSS